jgi:hypothetical protein
VGGGNLNSRRGEIETGKKDRVGSKRRVRKRERGEKSVFQREGREEGRKGGRLKETGRVKERGKGQRKEHVSQLSS